MRIFDYSRLKGRTWDSELLGLVAQLHEYKGRQEMYLRQKPADLDSFDRDCKNTEHGSVQ